MYHSISSSPSRWFLFQTYVSFRRNAAEWHPIERKWSLKPPSRKNGECIVTELIRRKGCRPSKTEEQRMCVFGCMCDTALKVRVVLVNWTVFNKKKDMVLCSYFFNRCLVTCLTSLSRFWRCFISTSHWLRRSSNSRCWDNFSFSLLNTRH